MPAPLTDQPITATCTTCGQLCGWIDCPTGGWWAHQDHPADGHDAAADETDLRELIDRLRASRSRPAPPTSGRPPACWRTPGVTTTP